MTVGSGVCLNNIAISQAVLNILTDFVLIFLPMPMLYHLKMPLKKKIIIGITFALGSTVVLASIARISYVKAMATNPDVTWTQASAAVWSSVELNLGVICNCILRLKPFVVSHFPNFARSLVGSNRLSYERPSGHSSGPLGWRGDKAATGFKLSSFEQIAPDVANHAYDHNIHIVEEFQAQVDCAQSKPKNGSTD
ncbi:hypothetical protein SLS62_008462 [Diatrype stigma]|uniref:Rhodopsin domain-containing protein n=1 Tax=Diatrype stigma TaxID=117547 RepID=A0AAN9ULN0_9PEZI